MGIEEQVRQVNAGLKARGARVAVQHRRAALFLVATLPGKSPELSGGRPHQQRVPLGGLAADAQGIRQAQQAALRLAGEMAAGNFDWTEWLPNHPAQAAPAPGAASGRPLVAEAIGGLTVAYWSSRSRTGAAERTWDRILTELNRLPPGAVLTTDLLVAVAEARTTPNTRSRLEACKVFKRLGRHAGLPDLEQLDVLRGQYEPAERVLPTDDALLPMLKELRDGPWGWATAALAAYGCRPAELFSLHPRNDGTATCLTVKRKGKLPTTRTTFALPRAWIDELALQDRELPVKGEWRSPSDYDSKEAKAMVQSWQKWLVRRTNLCGLYDMRHAWAVRSIRAGLNTSLAARCMGHDIAIHHRTYHRWMTEADILASLRSLA
jgi:hypothetical protein